MSNAVVICQHKELRTVDIVDPSTQLVFQQVIEEGLCNKPVFAYRTCGAGASVKCKKLVAYCMEHGGDPRAQDEMREHHKEHGA